MVRESLLDGLARPPHVHRVQTELAPELAADDYDRALEGVALDLAVMGIGPDGHTASLFPDAPALDITDRRAVVAEAGMEPFVPRVTMTPPELAMARTMLYLVTGESKAEAVKRAFPTRLHRRRRRASSAASARSRCSTARPPLIGVVPPLRLDRRLLVEDPLPLGRVDLGKPPLALLAPLAQELHGRS